MSPYQNTITAEMFIIKDMFKLEKQLVFYQTLNHNKSTVAGSGTCNGDSGGPLICDIGGVMKQFGVGAWSSSTCDGYAGIISIEVTL